MLSEWDFLIRLLLAFLLGGLIGIEREFVGKAAGFRTLSIVCAGSALIMLISIHMFDIYQAKGAVVDPSRIAAQVVSGIGFLGAGAIIRSGVTVVGLTTAATLWVCAAIGLAVGAGYYRAGVTTAVLVIVILTAFRKLEKWLKPKS